jgi:hypothetical protein
MSRRLPGMPLAEAMASRTDHVPDSRRQVWIDSLIGMVSILPLLLTAHLPLSDLPAHLARLYILKDWASSPYLQTFYYFHWAFVPNLALDVFVVAARQVMSIDAAVRLFCISTVLMLFLGTRLVNRELGGVRARTYRVAPLLCYGGPFQFGFLSYCFGIGLCLIMFGVYLRLRARPPGRLFLLVPLSFALLLCHLAAFALFAIAIAACEAAHAFLAAGGMTRRLPLELLKRQIRPVGCLLPALLLFLWLSPTAGDTVVDNGIWFSTLHDKLRSFAAITLFTSPKLEVSLLVLAIVGLTAALLGRVIRLHPVGLSVVVMMLIVWLLLPGTAFGTALVDYRLPWATSFFLLGGLVPGPRYNRLAIWFGGFFGTLALARIGLISILWLSWEPILATIDHTLQALPLGTRLMVVEGRLPSGKVFREPDLDHVAAYAVVRRQAFEPGRFASYPGQILYFQSHYRDLWQQVDYFRQIPSALDYLAADYDYVLVLLPDLARISPLLPLTCEAKGPDFELLRVARSNPQLSEADRRGRC